MISCYRLKYLFLEVLLVILLASACFPETFRVHSIKELNINAYGEKSFIEAGINDGILIKLPQDMTYIQGIELYFKVPEEVAEWRDCVAWSFYNNLTPSPSLDIIDYSGSRSITGTFSTSLSLTVQLPLFYPNTIKKNPYSLYIEDLPEVIDDSIFFRLQLVMKGIPDSVLDRRFEITAKPILLNKGKLHLNIIYPPDTEENPCNFYIDGKPIELINNEILLETGVHDLSIVSDYYRNELRTISIDQAKTTTIEINMRDITPLIRFVSPENTKIFVDDELISISDVSQFIKIQEGIHTLRFSIGDYEITKTINAINGQSYTISVSLDATITQEE